MMRLSHLMPTSADGRRARGPSGNGIAIMAVVLAVLHFVVSSYSAVGVVGRAPRTAAAAVSPPAAPAAAERDPEEEAAALRRLEELQRNVEQGLVSEGQPNAMALLQQTAARVEQLSGAVGALCGHMETMRVKEVASLAEERVAEIEARLGATQQEQLSALQQQAQTTQHHLVVRLAALEAAVQQEQQSSSDVAHQTHSR